MVACAASAGAHAGLVPEHLREEPRLGIAFIVAALLLSASGAVLAIRPGDRPVAKAAGALFAGLIAAYVASRTTGIPLLAPDREPVDATGVITDVVETLGLAAALSLGQPFGRHRRRPSLQEVPR